MSRITIYHRSDTDFSLCDHLTVDDICAYLAKLIKEPPITPERRNWIKARPHRIFIDSDTSNVRHISEQWPWGTAKATTFDAIITVDADFEDPADALLYKLTWGGK